MSAFDLAGTDRQFGGSGLLVIELAGALGDIPEARRTDATIGPAKLRPNPRPLVTLVATGLILMKHRRPCPAARRGNAELAG
jgi:hypothetical protein